MSDAADRFTFDAMHAVTGAYAKPIFVDKLGASLVCMYAVELFLQLLDYLAISWL